MVLPTSAFDSTNASSLRRRSWPSRRSTPQLLDEILLQISCRCSKERFQLQVIVAIPGAKWRPIGMLSSLHAPSACATACDSGGLPRLFPAPGALRASRNCAAASFLGTPLRVAFSSSRLAEPDRHCCRERGLARGRFSIDRGARGGASVGIFSTSAACCEGDPD